MKSKFLLLVSILLLLLTSTQLVSAIELRKIIKEELLESQYGDIGAFFGLGDRIYLVTYEGGVQERVWMKSGSLLSGATITSTPTGMTTTVGQAANYIFMAQAPDILRFTGGTKFAEHRFMMYDDTTATSTLVADIIEPNVSVISPTQISFVIPNSLPAGKRFYYIKEYVKDKTTGEWISGLNSQSSEWRFDVNVLPVTTAPVVIKTITVDTIPTNATILYLDSPIGVTAKDFPLQSGQTKILVMKQEGYITVMKGISSSTPSPFIITLTKAVTPIQTPPPVPQIAGETPVPTVTVVSTPIVRDYVSTSGSSSNSQVAGAASENVPNATNITGSVEEMTAGRPTAQEEAKPGLNLGLIGIILVVIAIIGYLAYTNLYVQKGKSSKKKAVKTTKSPKKKGGMWFD